MITVSVIYIDEPSLVLDYLTVNDPTLTTPLNELQRGEVYSELASGAETGRVFHFGLPIVTIGCDLRFSRLGL